MTLTDKEMNFKALRERAENAERDLKTMRARMEVDRVTVRVLQVGYHPLRGRGRALVETLLRRHRDLDPRERPLIPDVDTAEVAGLADTYEIGLDFEPSWSLDVT